MKAFGLFAVVSAALIAGLAWIMILFVDGPGAERAIRTSAVTAYIVQLFAFAVAKGMARGNVMAGWGIGVLMRLVTIAVFAFALIRAFALEPEPALISLVIFLFVTTLVEPVLLKK